MRMCLIGQDVCIDSMCEEPSVLVAGSVNSLADVSFIDSVQERAVGLKKNPKTTQTNHQKACAELSHSSHKCGFTLIRLSRVAWSWLLDRTLISSCGGGLGRVKELSLPTAVNPE